MGSDSRHSPNCIESLGTPNLYTHEMTTSTSQPSAVGGNPAANSFDRFVARCLDRAGTQVKIVDVATSLLLVVTVVLGVLLAVCIVDGWIIPLPSWARVATLVGLVTFAAIVLFRSIAPLVLHRISPAYAARMIEQSDPKFKNSLLNYVFLKATPQPSTRRVFEAVQAKAAHDLSAVAIESAIDRGKLIQVGFALVAVVVASGLYKIFSPKDPFTTVARVVAPLVDIPTPSRVRIIGVEPGSVDILYGETIDIIADVRGAGDKTPVALVYSTDDGQSVGASIPLRSGDSKFEYVGRLSTSDAGIKQSLKYFVVAGDGRSPTYSVHVQPSPTIAVTQVELQPPRYTDLPVVKLSGQSDIDAIEGTNVHLEASANQPIASATLELLKAPSTKKPTSSNQSADPPKLSGGAPSLDPAPELETVDRIPMIVSDRAAQVDFKLLRAGEEPKFTHFRLKFVTPNGQRNRFETLCGVRIRPDFAPELEVLEPGQTQLQVPVNGALPVRVRALDPDFRITAIRMIGLHKGKSILHEDLVLDQPLGTGNVVGQFVFRPESVGLQTGDELLCHFVALDNREINDQPKPNPTRSENYQIRIGPSTEVANRAARKRSEPKNEPSANEENSDPDQPMDSADQASGRPEQSNPADRAGNRDSKQDGGQGGGGDPQNSDEQSPGADSRPKSGAGSGNSNSTQKNPQAGDDGDPSEQRSETGGDQKSENSGSQSDGQPSDSQQSSPSNAADESSGGPPGQQGSRPPDESMEADDSGETGGDSMPPNQDGTTESSARRSSPDRNESAGNRPRESDDSGADPSRGSARNGAPNSTESKPNETESSDPGSANEPRPIDQASHDGERFEKMLEHINRRQTQSGNRADNQFSNQDSGQAESGGDRNDQNSSPSGQNSAEGSRADSANGSGDPPAPQQAARPGEKRSSSEKEKGETGAETGAGDRDETKGNADPAGQEDGNNAGSQPGASDAKAGGQSKPNSEQESAAPADDGSAPGSTDGGTEAPLDNDAQNSDLAESKGGAENPAGNDSNRQSSKQNSPDGKSSDELDQMGSHRPRSDQSRLPDSARDLADGFDVNSATPEEREELERSRRATDLVVEYLKDQQFHPDQELLDEMNWSEQELRDFVKRWDELKLSATNGNKSGETRYAEALRSLGLRNSDAGARPSRMQRDQIRDLNEDGAVSKPPDKFAEAFRDFSKGRAKLTGGQ